MTRWICAALALLFAPGCSDTCRVEVVNDVGDDVTITEVRVRLEGTTSWPGEDLLTGRVGPGQARIIRVPPSAPYVLDLQATDGLTRSWSRMDALVCDAPDEDLEITLTDADRDQPCSWTLQNDTGEELVGAFLRRTDTIAWTRALLEQPLAASASLEFAMDDDRPTWDLQARADAGTTLSRWTVGELGPCDAGEPLTVVVSGPPDGGTAR